MQLLALIHDSFRESLDRKIFWVLLLIECAVAAAMSCVAFEPTGISILFGTWSIETELFGSGGAIRVELITSIIVEWIGDAVLGSVGVLLAIIATAGFIPSMLDRGTIELLASKPLPRWKLLFGRYLGGLSFILFHALFFVVVTFIVAGIRWGVWVPRYLVVIPLIVLLFSYVYCVSALVGVYTRSTLASLLVSMLAWVCFAGVQSAGDYIEMFPDWKEYKAANAAAQTLRWIVPKTQDVTLLARKWSRAADPTELIPKEQLEGDDLISRARRAEAARLQIPAVYTIGSSLLFEAFVVLLALWKFTRSDY